MENPPYVPCSLRSQAALLKPLPRLLALCLCAALSTGGCEAGDLEGEGVVGGVESNTGTAENRAVAELPKADVPDAVKAGCSSDADCESTGTKLDACRRAYCDVASGMCAVGDRDEGTPCDDGEVCTVGDFCQAGACQSGSADSCDDENACTFDSCELGVGCIHDPLDGFCDDGDLCTVKDTCLDGVCTGTEPLDCGDGDPCTQDSCEPGSGCVHQAFEGPCDDEDLCTDGDVCAGGECHGTPVTCFDGKDCTDDVCDPLVGCAYIPQDGACDDGDACTQDLCDVDLGCVSQAVQDGALCDDSNACTESDVCFSGDCVGTPVLCSNDNPCMDAVCDINTGCVDLPNAAFCDDGDPCTTGDTCSGGSCVGVNDPWCGQGGCGDGLCDAGLSETCSSCPSDCGECGGGGTGGCGSDPTFTCAGVCGGSGLGCYCDSVCEDYGDCCPDKVACCGGGGGGGNTCGANPFDTCSGSCGVYDASSSCQCDDYCETAGDCCSDKSLCCGGGGGGTGGNDSCTWAFDNFCDEPFLCDPGTDCTDCGTCF